MRLAFGPRAAASAVLCSSLLLCSPASAEDLRTNEIFVPHKSTVPANAGRTVAIYVREKVLASVQADIESKRAPAKVVLFVHGGFSPAPVAFDLDYKDYSWMAQLARAGFDVFTLSHTAYGSSPKPLMDDPCNVTAEQQKLLIRHVLKEPCSPRYPFKLVSSQSEWDELASVVDYIRKLRGVEKISFIGWSTGTPRIGGFAAQRPELVDKLVFFAPTQPSFMPSDTRPATYPEPGAPTLLQTRETLEGRRWLADVKCQDQIDDPSVRDVMWKALMAEDGVGAEWVPGGVMRAPNRMNFGWRASLPLIKAPTLVLLGEFDDFENRSQVFDRLTMEKKVFVKVACGSHYLNYEKNRKVLHEASKEWLTHGTVAGRDKGSLSADAHGNIH